LGDLERISPEMTKASLSVFEKYVFSKELVKNGSIYTLTNSGMYIADAISADLFQ